jgi:hypothetical protein
MHLRTNSHYFIIQHYLTGFYNRGCVCLLRGTDWEFTYYTVHFRLQSVKLNTLGSLQWKHTSPSNRYLEAISFGPVHKRMPTPYVPHAPISYLAPSHPPLHCPGSSFRSTRALCQPIPASVPVILVRLYYLSRSFLVYFATSPTASIAHCLQIYVVCLKSSVNGAIKQTKQKMQTN